MTANSLWRNTDPLAKPNHRWIGSTENNLMSSAGGAGASGPGERGTVVTRWTGRAAEPGGEVSPLWSWTRGSAAVAVDGAAACGTSEDWNDDTGSSIADPLCSVRSFRPAGLRVTTRERVRADGGSCRWRTGRGARRLDRPLDLFRDDWYRPSLRSCFGRPRPHPSSFDNTRWSVPAVHCDAVRRWSRRRWWASVATAPGIALWKSGYGTNRRGSGRRDCHTFATCKVPARAT